MSRIDRCRPYLPPNASTPRPRAAVFDFAVEGNAPDTGLRVWSAESLSAQLPPAMQAIGREELNWHLFRLGLSFHDIVSDSAARFYLARALDARYLIFGTLGTGSAGIAATALMLNAESGDGSVQRVHTP